MNLLQETLDAIELSNKKVLNIKDYSIYIDKRNTDNIQNIVHVTGNDILQETELNFEYDDRSGYQYIEGFINFNDGSKLQRMYEPEYTEEGWEYIKNTVVDNTVWKDVTVDGMDISFRVKEV